MQLIRSDQKHKPAKMIKVKRRVYLELLDELQDQREQIEAMEKYEGWLNQAIIHLQKSEDTAVQEFVNDCVGELG